MHRYPSSLKSCSPTTLAAAQNACLRTLSLISVSSNKLSDIASSVRKDDVRAIPLNAQLDASLLGLIIMP
jgi:hypothetical protein